MQIYIYSYSPEKNKCNTKRQVDIQRVNSCLVRLVDIPADRCLFLLNEISMLSITAYYTFYFDDSYEIQRY